jgi:aromatic-amino-acid transaminase
MKETVRTRQGQEGNPLGSAMDEAPGASLVNALASTRQGNDTIFGWYARYLTAKEEGHDAVNGTAGILLENDGTLAINDVVDKMLREAPALEFSSYAPLKGLPDFLDLSISLALGEHREPIEDLGFQFVSTATPGGSGALFLAANNLCERGDAILLRDRHWGPYAGFIKGCGLEMSTWPLLPKRDSDYPFFAYDAFEIAVEELAQSQNTVMVWLNDPAHNPTGLTMTAEGRRVALDIMMASASKHPNVGHTLLLDTAYSLYATEPHGWGQTIVDAMEDGTPWPENFLITYALSLSKSHTAYGLRTGALIGIHPDEDVIVRLRDIFGTTGRQTWSAAPRILQYTASQLHANEESAKEWSLERDRLQSLLTERRDLFVKACQKHGVPINPTHDGFFAWLEHEEPETITEACAEHHVYLVPLRGGIRIGLCAMPTDAVERVAKTLATVLN